MTQLGLEGRDNSWRFAVKTVFVSALQAFRFGLVRVPGLSSPGKGSAGPPGLMPVNRRGAVRVDLRQESGARLAGLLREWPLGFADELGRVASYFEAVEYLDQQARSADTITAGGANPLYSPHLIS